MSRMSPIEVASFASSLVEETETIARTKQAELQAVQATRPHEIELTRLMRKCAESMRSPEGDITYADLAAFGGVK